MDFCVLVILAACIVSTIQTDAPRNIYKAPNATKLSDIKGSDTPWVKEEFVSKIQEFKNNVYEDLQQSPQAQDFKDFKTDSKTARDVYFKLFNKLFTDIGHPVPAAFANVVSKSVSLFEPLTLAERFEAVSINFAEFMLAHNIDIDRSTSQNYVSFVSSSLSNADLSSPESCLNATLNAYTGFIKSLGFELIDVISELFIQFSDVIITLHDENE